MRVAPVPITAAAVDVAELLARTLCAVPADVLTLDVAVATWLVVPAAFGAAVGVAAAPVEVTDAVADVLTLDVVTALAAPQAARSEDDSSTLAAPTLRRTGRRVS
jgi:hypothetical protein